jgi:hypothetical protein
MSVFGILEKLNQLDFNQLSMQERQLGEEQVRLLLDEIAKGSTKDHSTLTKKIALLKIWQKFDQLKIKDEQEKQALRESLKVIKKLSKSEKFQPELEFESLHSQDDMLLEGEAHSVSIMINEVVEVDGAVFQQGTVVEVPEQSAAKLIATEKTEKVEK